MCAHKWGYATLAQHSIWVDMQATPHTILMIGTLLIYSIMLIPAEWGDVLSDPVCLPPCNEPIRAH